jgi:hypothetical protein
MKCGRHRTRATGGIIAFLLLAAGISRPAQGAFISLQLDAAAVVSNRSAFIPVRVANQGDEAAHAVQLAARFEEQTAVSPIRAKLGVNAMLEEILTLTNMPAGTGTYCVVLTTRYADANHYPFSSVVPVPLISGISNEWEQVLGTMAPVRLKQKATLQVHLKTRLTQDVDTRLRLLLPDEIACERAEQNVMLFTGQDRKIVFEVDNFSGRPGSRYAVFALVDYDTAGRHHALIVPGNIFIAAAQSIWVTQTALWISIIVILITGALLVQLGSRRTKAIADRHGETDR